MSGGVGAPPDPQVEVLAHHCRIADCCDMALLSIGSFFVSSPHSLAKPIPVHLFASLNRLIERSGCACALIARDEPERFHRALSYTHF